jgi:hypothetical protein
MENLYSYLFWYNHYEELWYAIDRDSALDFFSGNKSKSVYYKSPNHEWLVELIVSNFTKCIEIE